MGTRKKNYLSEPDSVDEFIAVSDKKVVISSFLSFNKFQSPLVPLILHFSRIKEMGTVQNE